MAFVTDPSRLCFFVTFTIAYRGRAGEGISEPLSNILDNMLSDELFKHAATQIESLVLSCR